MALVKPVRAEFTIEHEVDDDQEEVEFQLKWNVDPDETESEDEPPV